MAKPTLKEAPTNGTKDESTLRRELTIAQTAKATECTKKIRSILDEYGFVLWGRPYLTEEGLIQAEVLIRPKG